MIFYHFTNHLGHFKIHLINTKSLERIEFEYKLILPKSDIDLLELKRGLFGEKLFTDLEGLIEPNEIDILKNKFSLGMYQTFLDKLKPKLFYSLNIRENVLQLKASIHEKDHFGNRQITDINQDVYYKILVWLISDGDKYDLLLIYSSHILKEMVISFVFDGKSHEWKDKINDIIRE